MSNGPTADVATAEAKVSTQHVDGPLYVDMVRSSPIARQRTFAFSVNPEKTSFFINDQVFDENRTDVTVKLGDTEKWTILNERFAVPRLHIHQTGLFRNGRKRRCRGFRRPSRYLQRSSDAMENQARPNSSFLSPIRKLSAASCFTAPRRETPEDKGMMMTVEVVRSSIRLTTMSTASETAYPAQLTKSFRTKLCQKLSSELRPES